MSGDKPPILFLHGAFCAGWVFDHYADAFRQAGYECIVPDLPHHRPDSDPRLLARLGLRDYRDFVTRIVREQSSPPILIGHSLGALIAMQVATQTPVSALTLLAPATPWGLLPRRWSDLATPISLLDHGFLLGKAVSPRRSEAERNVLNRLPPPKQDALFRRLVPESGRVLFETAHWLYDPFMSSFVGFQAIKAPVAILHGDADPLISGETTAYLADAFGRKQVDIFTFSGMGHWLIGEAGWQDTVEVLLRWIPEKLLSEPVRRTA